MKVSKNIKKKQSAIKLMWDHTWALEILSCILFAVVIIVTALICKYFTNHSLLDSIGIVLVCVAGGFLALILLNGFIAFIQHLIMSIVMSFRYAYLPLTKEEIKELGADTDPIQFINTISKFMCYKAIGFFEIYKKKAIEDWDTEEKLSQLFYELFFVSEGDKEPVILSVLNQKEKAETLLLSIKENDNFDLILFDLRSLFKLLRDITEQEESSPFTKVAYVEKSFILENEKDSIYVKAILENDKDFVLLNDINYDYIAKNGRTLKQFIKRFECKNE